MNGLKHPATIIAAIALFAALGGGAFAAVIIDGSHIKNHSIAKKKLTAAAVTSLQGHPGDTYEVKQNGDSATQAAGAVLTLTLPNLPAGAYSIFGKGSIAPYDANSSSSSCTLTAESDTDVSFNPLRTDSLWIKTIPTELTHTFTSTGTVTMACTAYADSWFLGGESFAGNSRIIAIRAGAQHATAASAAASRRPHSPSSGLAAHR